MAIQKDIQKTILVIRKIMRLEDKNTLPDLQGPLLEEGLINQFHCRFTEIVWVHTKYLKIKKPV